MEASLTRAQKVHRQLKAGRPRKIGEKPLSALDALQQIVDAADTARKAMRAQQLDPADIRVALVYKATGKESIGYKWLPSDAGKIGEYVLEVAAIAAESTFLGLLWTLRDRDADTADTRNSIDWTTPSVSTPGADLLLFAARHQFSDQFADQIEE